MADASPQHELDQQAVRRAMPPLEEAISRAQQGDKAGARELLRTVIRSEPTSEEAWVWLGWVADDDEERVRYLREAQALLPDSERISEALAWAIEQRDTGASDETASGGVPPSTSSEKGAQVAQAVSDQVDQAIEATQQGVSRILDAAKARASRIRLPHVEPALIKRLLMALGSTLAAVLAVAVVWTGVQNARRKMVPVIAMELPTPVADATATPTISQRCGNMWIQVDVAWTRQDWDAAISTLERIRDIDPYNEEARLRLGEAHYYRGLQYVEESDLEQGRLELDTAIRVNAKSADLQQARHELGMYLAGLASYNERDWSEAVASLGDVYSSNPGFRDTADMLGVSSYQRGLELENEERWFESRDLLAQATILRPSDDDAAVALQRVEDVITPPKRIEVDISDKVVTLFENHEPVYIFRVCTGRATAPTVPGNYEILDKIPNAYASTWDLDMPWWLGIYWAGGSENGFHALPLRGGSNVLWADALGTGCSFGCIVLETSEAKILYDWAEIGDKVIVRR